MKNKETLEGAISKFFENKKYPTSLEIAEFGAKWQEKSYSYSEEKVRSIAEWSFSFYKRNDLSNSELEHEFNRILDEQFKNK
jgi:hypothetical protein